MKILVVNKYWKIIVRTDKTHNARFPGCHAITVMDDRKIHVRRSSLNKVTILHELTHAYESELSLIELSLDEDQLSEWYAELLGKYGETMIDDAKAIIARFKK